MRYARHQEVVRQLREQGPLSVTELCASTDVSPATMRRDLEMLEADGYIDRVRGGAVLRSDHAIDGDRVRPFSAAVGENYDDKLAIAQRANEMINDGDVVLLDIGTTTMLLAQELRGRRVSVITASLAALDVLREDETVDLILLGGQVRPYYHSLVGSMTEDALHQVHGDIAFLSASGILPTGTIIDNTAVEVPVKRTLAESATTTVLLADKGKFPGRGALRVCDFDVFDVLITNAPTDDAGIDSATCAAAERFGVEIVHA